MELDIKRQHSLAFCPWPSVTVLPLWKDAVGVFYGTSRLGQDDRLKFTSTQTKLRKFQLLVCVKKTKKTSEYLKRSLIFFTV